MKVSMIGLIALKNNIVLKKNSEIIRRMAFVFNFKISEKSGFFVSKKFMLVYKSKRPGQKIKVFLLLALVSSNKIFWTTTISQKQTP